ncbi:MAG: Triosephosphate isomerase [Chlamydiae bacterium]|nr:Triosephosphate isomerase [Chlamydiota bacterium]
MKKRAIYIYGNWKLQMTSAEAHTFMQELLPRVAESSTIIGVAPPYTSINAAAKCAESTSLRIGAQNMSEYPKGAYTGEISSVMLKEAGAQFVLIGHSERRLHFHEDDQMIHRKVKWALEEGLTPLLCIGESQEERDRGMTREVLTRQLGEALKGLSVEQLSKILIAYEPVWAIGTGKSATPEMAQETHQLCRTFIAEQFSKEVAERVPILYGGSVKPENTSSLMAQADIDGALVGGASLDVESFAQIIKNAEDY